jgi:phage/plasmid-associated DNA primase
VAERGDESRPLAAPAFDEHLALVANEDVAVLAIQIAVIVQILRARRRERNGFVFIKTKPL